MRITGKEPKNVDLHIRWNLKTFLTEFKEELSTDFLNCFPKNGEY